MKSLVLAAVLLFVSISSADAAIFRPWWRQEEPKTTSSKKEEVLPRGYKLTGDRVTYNKKEGDRRLFIPDTNYNGKLPAFILVDDADKWHSVQPLLKVKHPVLDKINTNEDIVLIVFGGKRTEVYRQMVGDLDIIEKNGNKSVIIEVKVDDKLIPRERSSFGFSSAAVVVLNRNSLPKEIEARKENFYPLFRREKKENEKGKVKKISVFGPLLKATD